MTIIQCLELEMRFPASRSHGAWQVIKAAENPFGVQGRAALSQNGIHWWHTNLVSQIYRFDAYL